MYNFCMFSGISLRR